jgi:galactose mutarotase-like enzyme
MGFDTIRLQHGDVSAEIVPERGAIVSGLKVRGKDVLYMDRATLEDPTKNVRGGIPVLFPYAGKLVDEVFMPAGTKMKQHGFARNKSWPATEESMTRARLVLAQDAETSAQYPYKFTAEYSVFLLPNGLQVELLVGNDGEVPLPVSPGWHPYFCCPAPLKGKVTGTVEGFTPDKLGNDKEFDFGHVPPQNGRASFNVPELGKLLISFSPTMRHMQFWSQPGKDFICLEPFHGPNNTVNTSRRYDIPPHSAQTFWMRIELES